MRTQRYKKTPRASSQRLPESPGIWRQIHRDILFGYRTMMAISGRSLGSYASEMAWREDNRRVSGGERYLIAAHAALKQPVSRQWNRH
jgi:hypothetical protein